jgi:hypothetical protein
VWSVVCFQTFVFQLHQIKRSPCPTCLSSKSKQLVFQASHPTATCPIELIYTDVWDPAPILSRSGSKYYVSFLDAFRKYTWLYPMSCKSDVSSIFLKFKSNVKCYFNSTIKSVQSDWGGEYRPLHKILGQFGISHHVSCPHTHTNKMVPLNANTDTLSKLVLPYYLMQKCPQNFGMMLSLLLAIL